MHLASETITGASDEAMLLRPCPELHRPVRIPRLLYPNDDFEDCELWLPAQRELRPAIERYDPSAGLIKTFKPNLTELTRATLSYRPYIGSYSHISGDHVLHSHATRILLDPLAPPAPPLAE